MVQNWKTPDNNGYYDLSQIVKRLEWLDNERRKDKDVITLLEEKINQTLLDNAILKAELKETRTELSRYGSVFSRLEQLEAGIAWLRAEVFRVIEEKEKIRIDKEKEIDNARMNGYESLNRYVVELRKMIEPLQDVKKTLQTRMDDNFRLGKAIDDLEHKVDKIALERDDFLRFQKSNEEGRKQDAKRITDMQGELNAYRKRNEDMRSKVDLSSGIIQKVEQRVNEIANSETERRQQVLVFQEKIAKADMEREKAWTEWKGVFEEIILKAAMLDTQVQTLDNTNRSVKRSQDALDEATQRFDRRTNEMIEMQRLMEEKFRQEWTTFKADDQKRWKNYGLGQDEVQSEYERNVLALSERITILEDAAASTVDEATMRDELYVQQMQELFVLVRGWLEKMGGKK